MISASKLNSLNNFVYRFDANGTIDATYANHGVLSLGPGSVLIGHGGRAMLFASNAQATKVTPYTAAGAVDHGFANGLLSLAPSFSNSGAALSSAGDLYIWSCTSKVLVASCGLHHYNAAGQADTGFLYALPGDNYGYIEGFGLDGGIFVLSYSEPSSSRTFPLHPHQAHSHRIAGSHFWQPWFDRVASRLGGGLRCGHANGTGDDAGEPRARHSALPFHLAR